MSRHCYYNGGYNNTCEVDHHRYEEIPDIDPSMDFLVQTDDSSAFYYMESPTRLRGPVDEPVDDPAERSLLLRAVQQQQQQHNRYQQPPPNRGRRATPPSAGERPAPNSNRAAVTPCKARRRLDVVYGAAGTVSLPSTPPSADVVHGPVTTAAASAFTGVQYDRPRNTAVIQPIYKAPSSVFQVEEKRRPEQDRHRPESPVKQQSPPAWTGRAAGRRQQQQSLPVCTLWSAAMALVVSGTASCMLCLYLMSRRGRLYYLDAGLLSAAVCLALGFPGFRSQQWRWLPNRNYVTGYILVALFSALETCALWLMCRSTVLDPALNDIGAGVVCGISALSVALACLGVGTSYCCRYPPPDNRVAHAVEGFVV